MNDGTLVVYHQGCVLGGGRALKPLTSKFGNCQDDPLGGPDADHGQRWPNALVDENVALDLANSGGLVLTWVQEDVVVTAAVQGGREMVVSERDCCEAIAPVRETCRTGQADGWNRQRTFFSPSCSSYM